MKILSILTSSLVIFMSISQSVWAYNKHHGPFEKGKEPKIFQIQKQDCLQPLDPNYQIAIFGDKNNESKNRVHLMIHSGVHVVTYYTICNPEDGLQAGPEIISEYATVPDVFSADLNRDGKDALRKQIKVFYKERHDVS